MTTKLYQFMAACAIGWLILSWAQPAQAARIKYVFKSWSGPDLNIYVTRPVNLAADRPVVFVMHGTRRNADEYRDQWHDLANEHDFLLVVPEFSKRDFPGSDRYNLGNVFDSDGSVNPESNWSYSAVEKIFDDVKKRFGMSVNAYSLYGHSAGAQFVHRYIFYVPDARVKRIVAANAGWYMLPDFNTAFPYGLQGSAIDRKRLEKSLQLPVTILLGEKDTDPDHENLRQTPEAMEQGDHRLARGLYFYETARATAEQLGVPFNWERVIVQGAGHDNRLMAPAAVPYLLGK